MSGVGEQRQRVRLDSGDKLDNDEQAGGRERPAEDVAGSGVVVMMMMAVRV